MGFVIYHGGGRALWGVQIDGSIARPLTQPVTPHTHSFLDSVCVCVCEGKMATIAMAGERQTRLPESVLFYIPGTGFLVTKARPTHRLADIGL